MRPAFAALVTATLSFQSVEAQETNLKPNHPYAGMWVTDDNRVRHELLPNGRYEVDGTHIEYWDDTGFTADGDFVDANTLRHGGMILRRKPATT